eukprot:scaffold70378_cov61-Phaeocystis_antarctica.AAC.3
MSAIRTCSEYSHSKHSHSKYSNSKHRAEWGRTECGMHLAVEAAVRRRIPNLHRRRGGREVHRGAVRDVRVYGVVDP